MLTSTSAPTSLPSSSPPALSIRRAPVSWTTHLVALPQLSTSPPSLFQIRMRRSASSLGSSTISWSQPTPLRRSAIARARGGETSNGSERASITTKSLPSPCILSKRRFIVSDELRCLGPHRLDDLGSEPIHLLGLRAHLQQQQVQPGGFIFFDPFTNLFR